MAGPFLSLIEPPPPGFAFAIPSKRDLLRQPVALYLDDLTAVGALLADYPARMHGILAMPTAEFSLCRLGPLLWLLNVPPTMSDSLRQIAEGMLAPITEAATLTEREVELARSTERIAREFALTRDDYNRVTGELQDQLKVLLQAQLALSESEGRLRNLNDELERRVAMRTAELEALNQELEAFAYSVSHDLRAPLRAINGFGGMLQEDFGSTLAPEAAAYLQRMLTAAARMDHLIEDMLALARASNKTLEPRSLDLSELVQEAWQGMQHLASGRQVELRVAPGLHTRADLRLLRLVLENLLGNAIKFTRGRDCGLIEVGKLDKPGMPTFFVRDNGAGFDMNLVGKLFAPFQRLHSEREFEGTGIGLATAKRVIARHGGVVWAEGEVGVGACFYFSLPG